MTAQLGGGADVVEFTLRCEPDAWLTAEIARNRFPQLSLANRRAGRRAFVLGAGWPVRCLYGVSLWGAWSDPPTLMGAIPLRGTAQYKVWHWLPATPLWGGMAVDVAMFAGAWWIMLAGAGTVRRVRAAHRRRRGLCSRCGYDLRGVVGGVCPECGAGRVGGGQ